MILGAYNGKSMMGALTPIGEPNEPLPVASTRAQLRLGSSALEATVDAVIRLLPNPRLLFEAEIPPNTPLDLNGFLNVTFPTLDLSVTCDVLRASLFSTEPSRLVCSPNGDVCSGDANAPVSKAVFVVPNFPEFMGVASVEATPKGGGRRRDRIFLEFGEWRATIASTDDVARRKEILRESGGYAVTAMGELSRSDGSVFTRADAEAALEAIRLFLSFACGRWTGPTLPTGLDHTGEQRWQRWTPPIIDGGISVFTWFDVRHGEFLSHAMPGFFQRWTDPVWHDSVAHSIYWFVRANSNAAGADGSLILSQAALENLSWTYFVVDAKTATPKSFRKIHAADKIRLLLEAYRIPAAVPNTLPELQKATSDRNWADGPGAIASIRNNLVHPAKTGSLGPIAEAWLLSQKYIELCLLRLFNYVGKYADRTKIGRWVGDVEDVPWASPAVSPAPSVDVEV